MNSSLPHGRRMQPTRSHSECVAVDGPITVSVGISIRVLEPCEHSGGGRKCVIIPTEDLSQQSQPREAEQSTATRDGAETAPGPPAVFPFSPVYKGQLCF